MNQKFHKIVTFLKTQLNVRIISVYTRKSFCIFLLCVDLNGLFFMINVKSYNISIDQDDVDIKTSVLKLLDSSEVASIHSSIGPHSIRPPTIHQCINHQAMLPKAYGLIHVDMPFCPSKQIGFSKMQISTKPFFGFCN